MARIALIEPEHANPEVKQIYDGTLRGKPGNAQKALAHRPEMLKNFLSFYASVGRSLDRKLYELIYLRVSLINGCRYCTQHHVASSKRAGLTPDDWSALKQGNYACYMMLGAIPAAVDQRNAEIDKYIQLAVER